MLGSASADFYMHNPAGGNDRNRERNQNRNNGNRLFDSQNNGNGGYPWRGDAKLSGEPDPMIYYEGSKLATEWTLQHSCGPDPSTYCMVVLQYGCEEYGTNAQPLTTGPNQDPLIGMGGLRDGYPTGPLAQSDSKNGNVPTNLIYQKATFGTVAGAANNQNDAGTNTIQDAAPSTAFQFATDYANTPPTSAGTAAPVANTASDIEYGYHETWESYQACKATRRNKGLYTSDQKLNRNDARSTRQNPNGNRRGLECPEERDYYPYWRPTMWKDVAILASNEAMCPYFQARSQNTNSRWYCKMATTPNSRVPIVEEECTTEGGTWTEVPSWSAQGYADGVPECKLHQASRQNNLGNSQSAYVETAPGQKEEMASYDWTIPSLGPGVEFARCVLRARYNITTNDYPSIEGMTNGGQNGPWDETKAKALEDCTVEGDDTGNNVPTAAPVVQTGGDDGGNVQDVDAPGATATPPECIKPGSSGARPPYNRPYVMTYENGAELGIALNTDQSGRTFQDRSYVFEIRKRPGDVPAGANLINLNTRGARGNIVQSYPRVEYDFVPQQLSITEDDYLHIQWTGSDFNTARDPNNAEGWRYSDRANMIESINENQQFPMANTRASFYTKEEALQVALQGQNDGLARAGKAVEVRATNPTINGKFEDGTTNRYCTYFTDNNNGNMDEDNDPRNCGKLNFAANHFTLNGNGQGTGIKSMSGKMGSYAFVDTRNNNFSNRSQKMTIDVGEGSQTSGLSSAQIAGIVAGVTIPVVCIVIIAVAALAAVLAVVLTGSTGAVLAFVKGGFGLKKGSAVTDTDSPLSEIDAPVKPGKKSPPPKPRGTKVPPPKPRHDN
jgi:hypothetical protein